MRIVVVAERGPFFHRLRITDFSPPSIAINSSSYVAIGDGFLLDAAGLAMGLHVSKLARHSRVAWQSEAWCTLPPCEPVR